MVVRNYILLNLLLIINNQNKNQKTEMLIDGYLGSHNDEERSEMRYAMRIAEFRESSDLRTQTALEGYPLSMLVSVC